MNQSNLQSGIVKRFYGINEVALMYGIGRTSVYKEINEQRLKGVKIGDRTLISKDSLEEWESKLPKVS